MTARVSADRRILPSTDATADDVHSHMTIAEASFQRVASTRRGLAPAPLVIMLPDGFSLGGVSTWALRLARSLATPSNVNGLLPRAVCVVTHAPISQAVARTLAGIPGVELSQLPGSLRGAAGDLSQFVPAYRRLFERLAAAAGRPCVVIPNSVGDAYGIVAAISMSNPDLLRVIGWQHSDIAYDTHVLTHYEPIVTRFVGVSTHISERLRGRLSGRDADVAWIPYGVETPGPRDRVRPSRDRTRPVRLIYTGRIEHEQKRVGVLLRLPAALEALGIAHELTLVGDGPAAPEVDEFIASTPAERRTLARLAAVAPAEIGRLLDESGIFVLPSRYEGLSISMLEAMMHGCVPVVTAIDSGARDAVRHAHTGMLVETPGDMDDSTVARAMAEAIAECVCADGALDRLSAAAQADARSRFSLERHRQLVSELIEDAAASPPRGWPASRPCAFTASSSATCGSGSVPAEGAARLRAALQRVAVGSGRQQGEGNVPPTLLMLHGAGRHTIELASVLAESPVPIAGIIDDDPARWGTTVLGWTICSPQEAISRGVTDVIISSWMHADAVYARRDAFESRGVRVHHLYQAGEAADLSGEGGLLPHSGHTGTGNPIRG